MTHAVRVRAGEETVLSAADLLQDASPASVMYDVPEGAHLRLLLPFLDTGTQECAVQIHLSGPGARADIVGFHLGEGDSSLALKLTISHEARDTRCRTLFKNAMADRSTFDFRGLIRIQPEAAGSDDHLEERALLLSKEAKSLAIPALEIQTDDVKASHAAASGKLDPQELFYLESRGIPTPVALQMLIEGFFAPILQIFPKELIPSHAASRIRAVAARVYA